MGVIPTFQETHLSNLDILYTFFYLSALDIISSFSSLSFAEPSQKNNFTLLSDCYEPPEFFTDVLIDVNVEFLYCIASY